MPCWLRYGWDGRESTSSCRCTIRDPGWTLGGGLWRPRRRCREPLWIALDGVLFLFCLGFLGNLLGIGIAPGLRVRFSSSWSLRTLFRNRWYSSSLVRSNGPLACGCGVTGGKYTTGIGIIGMIKRHGRLHGHR